MIKRVMARYGSAVVVGTFFGWLAPGFTSLPIGAAAAAAAYGVVRTFTPSKGISTYE
jgi:hypothetical protein